MERVDLSKLTLNEWNSLRHERVINGVLGDNVVDLVACYEDSYDTRKVKINGKILGAQSVVLFNDIRELLQFKYMSKAEVDKRIEEHDRLRERTQGRERIVEDIFDLKEELYHKLQDLAHLIELKNDMYGDLGKDSFDYENDKLLEQLPEILKNL